MRHCGGRCHWDGGRKDKYPVTPVWLSWRGWEALPELLLSTIICWLAHASSSQQCGTTLRRWGSLLFSLYLDIIIIPHQFITRFQIAMLVLPRTLLRSFRRSFCGAAAAATTTDAELTRLSKAISSTGQTSTTPCTATFNPWTVILGYNGGEDIYIYIWFSLIMFPGLYSRRTADQMIKDGRVRVNFDTAVNLGTKILPKDKIFVDDLLLKSDMRIERPKIWMV